MEQIADQKLVIAVAYEPAPVPFAATGRRTENAIALPPTEGLWFAASGLGDFKPVLRRSVEMADKTVQFVLVGVSSLDLELSSDGLLITGAEVISVPEPGTLEILGIGLAGMGLSRRRKNA